MLVVAYPTGRPAGNFFILFLKITFFNSFKTKHRRVDFESKQMRALLEFVAQTIGSIQPPQEHQRKGITMLAKQPWGLQGFRLFEISPQVLRLLQHVH